MSPSTLVLYTLLTFVHLLTPNLAQLSGCTNRAQYCWDCSGSGNQRANNIYKNNLRELLLTNISKSTENFNHASLGQTDKVNAMGLCMGGLATDTCQSCLNLTSNMLLERCPNTMEGILWGELCLVRYSNASIFSVNKDEPVKTLPSPDKASDGQRFNASLKPLLDYLVAKAASSVDKYAFGSTNVSKSSEKIYALLQCTPDLSQNQCSDCLQDSSLKIPDGNLGARVLKPSCTLRYENGNFYDSATLQQDGLCNENAEFCWNCYINDEENDTSIGVVYKENLNTMLSSLYSNNTRNDYGFYTSSSGENSNVVNGIALCRGDISPEDCQSCVSNSSQRLLEHCPNRTKGILWDMKCMVRYSNENIFSVPQDEPKMYVPSNNQALNPTRFNQTLKSLLKSLIGEAASGDSRRKYGSGQESVPGYETIYGTAQCTPDLDKKQCSDCLEKAILFMPRQVDGKQGARFLKPSCNLRYEVNRFFGSTPTLPKVKSNATVVIAVVSSVIGVILIIVSVCISLKLRRKSFHKLGTAEEISLVESLQFDLGTIKKATDDFSDQNKLGQGGFGVVYKGILPDGQRIAVKRLLNTSPHGEKEFKNEVMLVAKLQHRNLVRLLGFYLDEKERLLVFEYMPNSSLDRFIFVTNKRAQLDWNKRYRIILGIVRGLMYLHEDSYARIIHRDLKASNILLDEDMNPKISDFGTAKLFVGDATHGSTSQPAGTYGYMAPEYAYQGQFSVKSDIFSFGVLILEIVRGEKISRFGDGEEGAPLTYAWKNWRDGTTSNLIDPMISPDSSRTQIMRCINIGLLCVQGNVDNRPTMTSIFHMFSSHSVALPVPSEPAFHVHTTEPAMPLASAINNSGMTQGSINEASISELYPR